MTVNKWTLERQSHLIARFESIPMIALEMDAWSDIEFVINFSKEFLVPQFCQ